MKVKEVIFKFEDGDYTVREDGIGDTIFGATAHKIMFAMDEHERKHPGQSIYKLNMAAKITFITKYHETIA